MNITIASGKGGTGKTTFAVNLAYFLSDNNKNVRLLDGDVEEPNDHLFLPDSEMKEEEVTVLKPAFNEDKCIGCGKCVKACKYNALALVKNKVLVFNELCHACGACSYVCPTNALVETATPLGKVLSSEAINDRPFYFAYGILNIAESLAPAVVKKLKEHMLLDDPQSELEKQSDDNFFPHSGVLSEEEEVKSKNDVVVNIIDSSPGTACPVVEALSTANSIAVLVTEPTPFGLHDLKLAVELALDMGNPTGIVINRSDGDDKIIADFANKYDIPILGRIPFDRKYAETYSHGGVLIKEHSELVAIFTDIFVNIQKLESSKPSLSFLDESHKLKLKQVVESGDIAKQFTKGDVAGYKEVVVISGKGGTGKTTITASLNQLCDKNVAFDADVDAADLHLLLKPQVVKVDDFSGSDEYIINSELCYGCGQCATNCHFDAITLSGEGNFLVGMTYKIDPLSCEGCGLCEMVCAVNAISSEPAETGESYLSVIDKNEDVSSKKAPILKGMLHAKLGVGGENSGKLVSHVRSESANFANEYKQPYIIGDGPPGTSCPVIASVTGADLILMVTEPTVSGVHDFEESNGVGKTFWSRISCNN